MVGQRLVLRGRLARAPSRRRARHRRAAAARRQAAGSPARQAEKESTLVGASLPRQSRLSCRCVASSARVMPSSTAPAARRQRRQAPIAPPDRPAPTPRRHIALPGAGRRRRSSRSHGASVGGRQAHSSPCRARAVARLVGADDAGDERCRTTSLSVKRDDRDAVDAAQRLERVGEARARRRAADRSGSDRRSPPCASPRRAGSGTSSSAPASCSAPRRG